MTLVHAAADVLENVALARQTYRVRLPAQALGPIVEHFQVLQAVAGR